MDGVARTADFAIKNSLQKVPVLELPDQRCLSQSNAILFFWPMVRHVCHRIPSIALRSLGGNALSSSATFHTSARYVGGA